MISIELTINDRDGPLFWDFVLLFGFFERYLPLELLSKGLVSSLYGLGMFRFPLLGPVLFRLDIIGGSLPADL